MILLCTVWYRENIVKKNIILRVLLLCMVPCGKVRNFLKRIVTYYITVASSMYGSWNWYGILVGTIRNKEADLKSPVTTRHLSLWTFGSIPIIVIHKLILVSENNGVFRASNILSKFITALACYGCNLLSQNSSIQYQCHAHVEGANIVLLKKSYA